VASDVVSGLEDAVAFSRGTLSLQVRAVDVPDPVDVRALRSKLGLMESAGELFRNGSRAAPARIVPCTLT
jgi:hypothetical protein